MQIKIDDLQFNIPDGNRAYSSYEEELREGLSELRERMPKNLSVIELGGGIGILSCFLNRKLDNPKKQIVVEANPDLIDIIEQNKKINECSFTVLNKVLSYKENPVFFIDKSFVASSEKRGASPTNLKKVLVAPIRLKDIVKEKSVLVSDIEGNDIEIIKNEMNVLKKYIVLTLIEFHPRITGKCSVFWAILKLRWNGFKVLKRIDKSYVLENTRI